MNTPSTWIRFLTRQNPPRTNPTLRMMILYEDFTTGQRAARIWSRLARRFANDFEFRCKLWRVDLLDNSFLNRIATADAARADLVVFSVYPEFELTPPLIAWVEAWLPKKSPQDSALAALVCPSGEFDIGIAPIKSDLQAMCQRAGIVFLPPVVAGTRRNLTVRIAERSAKVTRTLNEVTSRNFLRPVREINV